MITFCSLLTMTFCTFFNTDCAFAKKHEALVVIDNFPSPFEAILPYKAKELDDQIIYPNSTEVEKNIEYSYLCPPQTPYVVHRIKQDSKTYPELAFLLEKTLASSTKQSPKCPEEVKPVFSKSVNSRGSVIKCGKLLNQMEYNFAFAQQERQIVQMKLYDICLDLQNSEVLWTKHLVAKTSMLQEPGFLSQQIHPPYGLSTEEYAFSKGTFLNIAKDYEHLNQVKSSSNSSFTKLSRYFRKEFKQHRLIPQMMVPQEDLALKLWKKSATHYVNTAPLWDKLVPVMKAINDGLRKAVIAASAQYRDTIYTYTTAYACGYRLQLGETCFKSKHLKKHRYNLNIWCKFIHNESKNTGLMVFLHNIPDKPPKKIKYSWFHLKSKISLKNIECKEQVPCDFRKWADDPAGLSNELLDYAYCCEVDNDKVEEFFNIKLNIKLELFNLDRIIDERSEVKQY